MQRCPKCRNILPLSAFNPSAIKGTYCKQCRNKANTIYSEIRREDARKELQKNPHKFNHIRFAKIKEIIAALEIAAFLPGIHPAAFNCILSEMNYQTELYLEMARFKPRRQK